MSDDHKRRDSDRENMTDHDMLIGIHQVVVGGELDKRVRSLETKWAWAVGAGTILGTLGGWISSQLGGK